MNFIPEQPLESQTVPFFDEATKEDGWQGQATTKSIKALQAEIIEAISRLGGLVISFQRGLFEMDNTEREGYRVHYVLQSANGNQVPGRIDIAALPCKPDTYRSSSIGKRKEASLKMALYMLRISLEGTWFLQQLSPGYSGLVSFMLGKGDKTISQMWSESSAMDNLLPPGEEDFIEGESREIK